ncbi:MAG: tRNA (adenosine(37)-N6)-dimethylallyltransferase MiaA [Lentisphaeria bacterium]|nr:tRNA (adenosine(37)-N6)-dimethylallyltransferase MiaA [Lentisphaeria bacterium]
MIDSSKLLVISGATASGKSSLALEAAKRIGGEIISVDSMQLYRDLPVGTAQPSEEEKSVVPHHLTGIYELDERSEVFRFCSEADEAINKVRKRGNIPVLCGGTGLYLKALLYGLDDLPGDRELRRELDEKYDSAEGEKALYARMMKVDPEGFAKWKDCRRRLIRALEVYLLTGKSIIALQQGRRQVMRYETASFVLERESGELKERISLRADEMLKNGWIEEAEAAIKKGLFTTPTAHQALGYKQIAGFLQGEFDRKELHEKICTATWQYARRQRTWFRHQHPEAEKFCGGVEDLLLRFLRHETP